MVKYNINGNRNRIMPKAVRFQCEWILKDYDRLKGLASNASLFSETEDAVVFYADDCSGLIPQAVAVEAGNKIDAIMRSLDAIPEEYRREILEYFTHGAELPDYASHNTWKKWKSEYLQALARELSIY